MKFSPPLIPGVLIAREKRFLAHVRLASGEAVVAHTSNTGSMTGVSEPGSRVWVSPAEGPRRKLAWTWEIVETLSPRVLVGINTLRANALAQEGIESGLIAPLAGYDRLKREARAGPGTRFDFLLGRGDAPAPRDLAWVEAKSVTLLEEGRALFPDAVTQRGRRHLLALTERKAAGERAVLLFIVQRADARSVGPADAIDPAYGRALRQAAANGVEILGYKAAVSPKGIDLTEPLPVLLP